MDQEKAPYQEGRVIGGAWLQCSGPRHLLFPQRAIRVRSHSMETMVSSQKKPHGGGLPGSLSGGISHNSTEVTKTTFSVSTLRCWGPPGCSEGGGDGFTQPWSSQATAAGQAS